MTKKTTSLLAAAVVGVAAIVIAAIGGVFDSSDDSRLLVTADELADLQATGDVVVVDARDPEDYAAGAIPGAASLHTETLNQTITLEDGTEVPRLVKDADDIARPLRAAGIRENRPVVVYDNGAETSATRVFWVLDYYGHDDVRVLDGGVAAWTAAGHALESEPSTPEGGDFTPVAVPERHADYEYVQQAMFSDSIVLCNALSAESYEEGSIETSTNLHATSLFADGDVPYFRGDDVLADLLAEAGYEDGEEFVSFCGSGYMASINYFAARLLGIDNVRMYDGSLVDWNARGGPLLPSGATT